MTARRLVTLCVFLLSALCSAQAQNYLYATGSPMFSTTIPVDQGFVDLNNGNLHLEIPLASKQQRGDLILNEKLVYDSRIWQPVNSGSTTIWQPTNVPNSTGGWVFSSGLAAGSVTYSSNSVSTATNPCSDDKVAHTTYTRLSNWMWTDPGGTKHTFYNPQLIKDSTCTDLKPNVDSGSSNAGDGSGYTIQITNYTTITISDVHGITYHPSICQIGACSSQTSVVSDRNGNSWNTDASGNLVDTSGTAPVLVSSNNTQIFYDVIGVNGKRNRYTVTMMTVNFSTSFAQSGVQDTPGSFQAIQSIGLPDGSSYQFGYDSGTSAGHYGTLTSMTMPTGGTVQYGYAALADAYGNYNSWLGSLTKDSGSTYFTLFGATGCSTSAGCQQQVKVQSPTLTCALYTFTLDPTSSVGNTSWVNSIKTYQTCNNIGTSTPLQATQTTYVYSTSSGGKVPSSVTNTVSFEGSSYQTQTTSTFDLNTGLPTETKAWDYFTGSGPSPTTDTVYTYGVANFPSSMVVKDGAGNQLSSTTYGYDEATLVTTSGLPNHTAAPGPQRGNRTSEHDWINTSGSTLDTFMTYDDAGAMLTSTSPTGKTTYGHDATDTFVTSTTAPTPSSGVALTTTTAYDTSTGAVTSTADANNQSVNYKNFDVLNRPQEVDNPDGAITQIAYTPTQVSVAAQNSATGWTIQSYDGYGRLIRTNVATGISSNPWYMQDTCYNTTGQVSFQSYRLQGQFSQPPVCSGAGDTYNYDALGRVTQITHGDGKVVRYSYTGRATQVTDENGVSKITQTDAFGRMAAVCELTTGSVAGSGTPGACGTDIAGTGFLTSYIYDLANHKTSVTQGVQTRVFQTDSLSRTILTQEPEPGQTTYSYSYNSTGLLVTRSKPRANQTSATVLTTTQTQYDAAGRVVSVVHNDGTPNRIFAYDLPQNWTNFAQLNLKGRMAIAHSDGGNFGNNYGATTFSYDAMGRTAKQDECLPGFCGQPSADHMLSYTYDYAGNVLSASNGTGTTVGYAYTPAGEATSISFWQTDPTHPYTLLSNVTNGPFGPSAFQYGSGLNGVRSYNSLGKLAGGWVCSGSTSASCTGGTQLYGFTVTPQGGRVNQACDSKLGNCANLGYDDLNRLTARTTTSGTTSNNTWSYDRYGNRWSQTATLGGNGNFSYNTANNRENGFSYDAAGNMTSDGLHSYTYDAEGNITQVDGGQTATYTYDAMNRRVRTVVGSQNTEFVFSQSGQRVSTWNGANGALMEEKAYWGSRPLASSIGGVLYYEHQDWLGTERLRTTASGAVAGSYASGPFGDSPTTTGTDGDPYHFAMLDHDNESGLEHAQFRGYSSAQGHWMSPDPYSGSYDGGNPQSFNRYAYALNRPASETDPTGEDGCGDDMYTGLSGSEEGHGEASFGDGAPSGYTQSGVNTSDGNPIYSDPSGNMYIGQAPTPPVQNSGNDNEFVPVNSSNPGFGSLGLVFYTPNGYGQRGYNSGGFANGPAVPNNSLVFAKGKGERNYTSKPDKPLKGVRARIENGKVVGWSIPSPDGKRTPKNLEWGRANGLNENDPQWVIKGLLLGAVGAASEAATGITWWEILAGAAAF